MVGDNKLQVIAQASPSLAALLALLPRIAQANAPVLISGETGTGKELFARAIHYLSTRSNGALVPINCAALPVELVDSEFFGHVRGAFTGAHATRKGLIAQAEGGTLFLDEVDSLPLVAQGKLLRVLQEQEYRPVGADCSQHSDVRILTATNRNIENMIRRGEFRQDLYYRLKVLTVNLPALRERREDVLPLARYFMAKYAAEYHCAEPQLSDAALRLLMAHPWPGNVRELEHVIERACLMHTEAEIKPSDLDLGTDNSKGLDAASFKEAKQHVVDTFERGYLEQLLARHLGNVSRAAAAAQKNRRALWELLRRHEIDPNRFRVNQGGH
jgi:two-component system, NtrC family, response regulator GlrR